MIKIPTLFVLGAGASSPYGFPTGAELSALICGKAHDKKTYSLPVRLQETLLPMDEVEEFVRAFEGSGQPSIDAFIVGQPKFALPGRVAIARILCQYEIPQVAFNHDTEGNWYKALWREMTTSPTGNPKTAAGNVRFLTFNYDRSLEHFFFTAARNTFENFTDADAFNFLQAIEIEHVYGQLGQFHYLPGEGFRRYSNEITVHALGIAANGIHLIGTGRKDAKPFLKARKWFKEAEVICFLGFGFDEENVYRLSLDDVLIERSKSRNIPRIIASMQGKAPAQIDRIREQLCPSNPVLETFPASNLETLAFAGLIR